MAQSTHRAVGHYAPSPASRSAVPSVPRRCDNLSTRQQAIQIPTNRFRHAFNKDHPAATSALLRRRTIMSAERSRYPHPMANPYVYGDQELKTGEMDYNKDLLTSLFAKERRSHLIVPWIPLVCSAVYAGSIAVGLEKDPASMKPFLQLSLDESFLSSSLGFLLGIRLNSAYQRWWEARSSVSTMLSGLVELGTLSALTMSEKDRYYTLQLLSATTQAFADLFDPEKAQFGTPVEGLDERTREILNSNQGELDSPRQRFDSLMFIVRSSIRDRTPKEDLQALAGPIADRTRDVQQTVNKCLAIYNTAPPLGYTSHMRVLLIMFITNAPLNFAMKGVGGWQLVVLTLVLAYAFLGLDALAVVIAHPFGQPNADNLPVNSYAAQARAQLDHLLLVSRRLQLHSSNIDNQD